MRRGRILSLRRRRWLGVIPVGALIVAGWGCQQPPCCYYYGAGAPPCTPAVPVPSTVPSGVVCEVPQAQVVEGGKATADVSGLETTVNGAQGPPRIVVSEPASRPRLSWRRADP